MAQGEYKTSLSYLFSDAACQAVGQSSGGPRCAGESASIRKHFRSYGWVGDQGTTCVADLFSPENYKILSS